MIQISLSHNDVVSENRLKFLLYPDLGIKKVSPLYIPLSATSYANIALVLNLQYSHCFIQSSSTRINHVEDNDSLVEVQPHITSLPVYVKISYTSVNTKIPVEVENSLKLIPHILFRSFGRPNGIPLVSSMMTY
jgi:hypothetical protein